MTITAGDYSVEMPINQKAYEKWVNEVYSISEDKLNGVSVAMSLK